VVVKWKYRENEGTPAQVQNLSVVWTAKISNARDSEMPRRFYGAIMSTTTMTGEQAHGIW
jgi:hypothetical protein